MSPQNICTDCQKKIPTAFLCTDCGHIICDNCTTRLPDHTDPNNTPVLCQQCLINRHTLQHDIDAYLHHYISNMTLFKTTNSLQTDLAEINHIIETTNTLLSKHPRKTDASAMALQRVIHQYQSLRSKLLILVERSQYQDAAFLNQIPQ